MEEAAQILEIETLIPMLLQNADVTQNGQNNNKNSVINGGNTNGNNSGDKSAGCRLKRIVLIGDHFQLPPVVKHIAFQKHAHLDQSLFTRFIRLGVPAVLLNKQGRARPEIAALYSWRYSNLGSQNNTKNNNNLIENNTENKNNNGKGKETLLKNNEKENISNMEIISGLGDLPLVSQNQFYRVGNAGFVNTFQLIDVPEFQGKGEFCPTPYFYQNLGEAEYIVAVYQYMRLLGYPAEKISIITTYNGQKHLIRDIISQRCKGPMFGQPASITTGKET